MIDSELLGKLSEYCDQLIDGSHLSKTNKKVKQTNFSSGSKKYKKEFSQPRKERIIKKCVEECSKKVDTNKINYSIEKTSVSKAKCRQTEDGFRILSEILPDDSDVSDAFESDSESECLDNTPQNLQPRNRNSINKKKISKLKNTSITDGFELALDNSAGGSDVSDPFVDDEDTHTQSQDSLKKEKNKAKSITPTTASGKKQSKSKINDDQGNLSSIKKPLLKIIEDFDLKDKILQNQLSHLSNNRIDMPNKVFIPNSQLTLIDYSFRKNQKKEKKIEPPDVKKPKNAPKRMEPTEAQATLKKMKNDLINYRINGLPKFDRQQAKIEYAIKLGAKPPKNKAVNYKCLIQSRKEAKEKAIAQRKRDRQFGMLEPQKKKVCQRKRFTAENPTNIHPKMGMFKGGVLKLDKNELEKIMK